MNAIILVSLTIVAVTGTLVVLTDEPRRQAVTYSFFGLTLGVAFLALQAPDVALSQIAVGAAVVPLMILLADRTVRREVRRHRDEADR